MDESFDEAYNRDLLTEELHGGSVDGGGGGGDYDDDDGEDAAASDSSDFSSVSGEGIPPIREYGHSYHGSGRMVIPNDACENERQRIQHELFTFVLGGNLTFTKLHLKLLSPQMAPYHILDVGCGGGHWAMALAQKHPLANVLGIELSGANLPVKVPPNLTFEIADAAAEWPPALYDFIHMRNLIGGGIRDWRKLIHDAWAHIKPGGHIEFTELTPLFFGVDPDTQPGAPGEGDDAQQPQATVGMGAACSEYLAHFSVACQSQGLDFDPIPKVGPWLLELGAEGLRQRSDFMPLRPWANDPIIRKKGEIVSKMMPAAAVHWTYRLFAKTGHDEEYTRDLVTRVIDEMQDPTLKACVQV
ncbi:Trans-aconitate 2-methyltransferase [Escovopsis weberi]|uniref:Trans-aconitate 2-methyltransferase n=1 Tax=Escovopsis weberi TaxID=150374 RepID=A0A0M9VRG9_ESCWE|nr:Trans-aconitate 2-methyltransferase [Escovopsis weberi]